MSGKSGTLSGGHQQHGGEIILTFLLFSTYPRFFQLILALFSTEQPHFFQLMYIDDTISERKIHQKAISNA